MSESNSENGDVKENTNKNRSDFAIRVELNWNGMEQNRLDWTERTLELRVVCLLAG